VSILVARHELAHLVAGAAALAETCPQRYADARVHVHVSADCGEAGIVLLDAPEWITARVQSLAAAGPLGVGVRPESIPLACRSPRMRSQMLSAQDISLLPGALSEVLFGAIATALHFASLRMDGVLRLCDVLREASALGVEVPLEGVVQALDASRLARDTREILT